MIAIPERAVAEFRSEDVVERVCAWREGCWAEGWSDRADAGWGRWLRPRPAGWRRRRRRREDAGAWRGHGSGWIADSGSEGDADAGKGAAATARRLRMERTA